MCCAWLIAEGSTGRLLDPHNPSGGCGPPQQQSIFFIRGYQATAYFLERRRKKRGRDTASYPQDVRTRFHKAGVVNTTIFIPIARNQDLKKLLQLDPCWAQYYSGQSSLVGLRGNPWSTVCLNSSSIITGLRHAEALPMVTEWDESDLVYEEDVGLIFLKRAIRRERQLFSNGNIASPPNAPRHPVRYYKPPP